MYKSITELVEITGLSRDHLKKLSRIDGAPVVKTIGGGKILFEMDKFHEFLRGDRTNAQKNN